METHGQLLKKLIRRKKLTNEQAAELLGFSRQKLNRLFNKDLIDEITREEIENIFQVAPSYFPTVPETNAVAEPPGRYTASPPDCWQQLVAAQAKIIELQQQIIDMSRPSVNAPVGRTKEKAV